MDSSGRLGGQAVARPVQLAAVAALADPSGHTYPTRPIGTLGAGRVPWARVEYSDRDINWAGRILADPGRVSTLPTSDWAQALVIVNNFRTAHSYPLNTFQVNLRRAARQLDPTALVAQRIKRLPSTLEKLHRFPKMKLTQMQDIGGCRAIVSTVSRARGLHKYYKETSRIRHRLVAEKDYINEPKDSGYRGIHLVYRYTSDRHRTHNGLKVEIQLRTRPQHYWANAVETVGTMLRQALKSSAGESQWLRFFALAGSAIAIREKSPTAPGTPSNPAELIAQLRESSDLLDVRGRLMAYGSALRTMEDAGAREHAHYFLVEVDPARSRTDITGFAYGELEQATARYLEVEKALPSPGAEAVLVSVSSIESLRAAYPSYFLDSQNFLRMLEDALAGPKRANGKLTRN